MTPTSRTRARGAVLAVALSATATLALAPAAAGEQSHAAQSVTVPIRDFTFTPSDLMINTGDTVTWVNEDRAPHDATTTSAPAQFASGTLNQGQSFSYTFAAPGTYSYQCTIHPDMVATVLAMDHSPAPAEPPPAEAAPPAGDAPAPPVAAGPVPGEPLPGAPAPGAQSGVPGAVPASSVLPVPADTASTPSTTQAVGAAQGKQLNPLLIVAGIALGVATLCLLLVIARPTERGQ